MNYPYINHIDGNKLNNDLSNLEWCTSSYNQLHAYRTNLKTLPKGELNGRSILTEDQVIEINNKLIEGCVMTDIAKEYDVKVTVISEIKYRRSWTHITEGSKKCTTKTKSVKLDEDLVHKVCKMFEEGLQVSKILIMLDNQVTKDQLYDLKRKRGFKHITKLYTW